MFELQWIVFPIDFTPLCPRTFHCSSFQKVLRFSNVTREKQAGVSTEAQKRYAWTVANLVNGISWKKVTHVTTSQFLHDNKCGGEGEGLDDGYGIG